MDLNVLIESVKNAVGAIIEKPKMTEKLLVKPPFRFLHDTITAIIKKTGFGEGLFNEIESDSAAVTDKDAKLAYLQKIFNLVGICQVNYDYSVFVYKWRLILMIYCFRGSH